MTIINLNACVATTTGKARSFGRFQRREAELCHTGSDNKTILLHDAVDGSCFSFFSLVSPVKQGQELSFRLDSTKILGISDTSGLRLRGPGPEILIPAHPRFLLFDDQRRISAWKDLGLQLDVSVQDITLTARAPGHGWIELAWVSSRSENHIDPFFQHPFEFNTFSVEGCWSNLKSPTGFWNFISSGRIYNGRPGRHGRFQSPQTAFSLFKIASVLARRTGKNFYSELAAEISYSTLLALDDEGIWKSGEWMESPEIHMRFQLDGVNLMLAAHTSFMDPVFLDGAERAAHFVLKMKDELENGGWWFLHDSLELDEKSMRSLFPGTILHTALGKRLGNTLTLNTHLSALSVIKALALATENRKYRDAYDRGKDALRMTVGREGNIIHLLAEKLVMLSFENQDAPWARRGFRFLTRRCLLRYLTRIHLCFPCFNTPNGYLWRDMSLPSTAYWYHLVNLYDLLLLYRQDPDPQIEHLIVNGISFTLKSNLIEYLLSQKHYIAPQWLQILKACHEVFPHLEIPSLLIATEDMYKRGYGIPPEVLIEFDFSNQS